MEWRYVAGRAPPAAPRVDPAPALGDALRAAAGQGVRVRLLVDGHRDPTVHLVAVDPASERWARRTLFPAYGDHRWRTERAPPPALGGRWEARRIFAWPNPLHDDGAIGSRLDAVVRAARSLPARTRFQVEARPGPVARRPLPVSTPEGGLGIRRPAATVPYAGPSRLRAAEYYAPEAPVFWWVRVALTVAASRPVGEEVVSAVEAATRSSRGNGLRFRSASTPFGRPGREFLVTERELIALLPWAEPSSGGAEPSWDATGSLPIGRTPSGQAVGVPLESAQGRHLAVLGETGMGKSSLVVALVRRAAAGAGVILLDPLGETAGWARRELTPIARDRLVWISPDPNGPTVNALEGLAEFDARPNARSERRLGDLVGALRRVRAGRYVDSAFWGPRLEEMLVRAVRAAGALPGGTLEDAHTLLATGGRTSAPVPPVASAHLRELGERIRARPDDAEGARRLLYEVVRSPVLARALCAREPSTTVRELVAPGRIVLVSGAAGAVGESVARYLLATYLALLWSELLARPGLPKTFVFLDEVQWYAHESLAEMLRLARRRNVHLVVATQGLAALPDDVREAVWTNVADVVAFRGSPEEARAIARAVPAVPAETVLALPRGDAVALLGKGERVEWLRTARVPVGGPEPPDDPAVLDEEPVGPPSASERSGEGVGEPGVAALAWIARRAAHANFPAELSVDLAELRGAVDPSGRAVREAGRWLGRAGALLGRAPGPRGPVWRIRTDRLPGPDGPPRAERSGSSPAQPS